MGYLIYVLPILFISTSKVHADSNAQSRFERDLRTYFATYTGGRDAIDDIYFVRSVDADYTRANRADRPNNGEDIEYEIAYIRVFERILCRVGIGYASMGRFEFDVDPAVFAECVPVTKTQSGVVTSANLLPDLFDVARSELLGSQTSTKRNFPELQVPSEAVAFSFEGSKSMLKASRLYFLGGGRSYIDSVERAVAVRLAHITTTYDTGVVRTDSTTTELWAIDFVNAGKEFALRKSGTHVTAAPLDSPSKTEPVKKRSCVRALMDGLGKFMPIPLA